MSESERVSALMLERYNLGEVTGAEKEFVEAAMTRDPSLAERLEALRRSDRDIRSRRGPERFLGRRARTRRLRPSSLMWGAAALFLLIALPFLGTRFSSAPLGDRAKGGAASAELSVFLKSDAARSGDPQLPDQAALREGNTVQLAYRVDVDSYGVIFSIDGRSAVTMHYPYGPDRSARLIPGKRVALEEAYTLDDAPDYELFFFVVSDKPLDVPAILRSAERLARDPATAVERSGAVFRNYAVKTVTLRKE
jgi:hypothetical protein